jgi:hypothetical protein
MPNTQQSDDEEALASVEVAEPAAGDQQARIGDRIGGDDELDLTEARIQIVADRRHCNVYDRNIQDRHEGAHQHHGEHQPLSRPRRHLAPDLRFPPLRSTPSATLPNKPYHQRRIGACG